LTGLSGWSNPVLEDIHDWLREKRISTASCSPGWPSTHIHPAKSKRSEEGIVSRILMTDEAQGRRNPSSKVDAR
jgi:hypothetical protein